MNGLNNNNNDNNNKLYYMGCCYIWALEATIHKSQFPLLFLPGTCLCYFCKYARTPNDFIRMESFDGPQNGLLLVLKVEVATYLPFIVEAGFLVAIHDQGVEVDFTKDGVFIQPLTTTFIGRDTTVFT